MYWRIGGAYRGRRAENREALRKIVERGSAPGLVASTATWQWAGASSRRAMRYPGLIAYGGSSVSTMCPSGRYRVSSCADYRQQGVMSQLTAAALKTAKRAKAPALEAYPVDTSTPKCTSNIFTGTVSAFTRAGFKEVARRAAARPIMRHDLKAVAR
jgi:hypothetical protein